ncbi:MAG TPA: hypothetical protein VK489_09580 [Ferruginibacter sp.]|nr:hypothetical protein [Ferruginibacter sp.]
MVKIILSSMLFIISAGGLNAQVKKLRGYAQSINGGARQDDNAPGRGTAMEVNERFFVFAEVKKGQLVVFEEIWIKGHLYSFKIDTIHNFPFVMRWSNGGEAIYFDTLVRSAGNLVIQLKDLVRKETMIPKKRKGMLTKNNMLIFYRHRGKLQSMNLQKLRSLRPIFTQ